MGDTPLAGRRILVVDDQPSIRGILETALSEAGADVWSVPDGPTAITLLETANPELIAFAFNPFTAAEAAARYKTNRHNPISTGPKATRLCTAS